MSATGSVRVLLVDDSATVRAVLCRLLQRTPGIEVVGQAGDGEEAIAETLRLRPDIVVMDIEMPGVNGFVATERIMALRPTPILVLSSRANRDHVRTAFEAVRRGALDVLPKPEDPTSWEHLALTLPHLLRTLAFPVDRSPAQERRGAQDGARTARPRTPAVATPGGTLPEARAARDHPSCCTLLLLGASTGGPGAVRDLLAALPPPARVTTLVVQHIAAGFEDGLADWLAHELKRDVRVARHGETPPVGAIRLACAGAHLVVAASGSLELDTVTPARHGHRPSIDELFLSCLALRPRELAAVVLTGMGSDGAEGLVALRQAGALTLVQDGASSVVDGMPRAAFERGGAVAALPPAELARELARCCLVRSP